MLPILFSFGPVKIYSFGLVLAIGLFLGLYWWWKMGRDEHLEEIELFDAYFLSLIVFIVSGRVGYAILNPEAISSLYRFLAILAYPGVNGVVGIMGMLVFLFFFVRAKEWNIWKVADCVAVTLASIIIFVGLGGLLNGSNPGAEISWGLMYPGESVKRFPIDVWIMIWSLITFAIVSRVRKNFRFYAWYKGEASVAQDGLAALIFSLSIGIYYMVVGWMGEAVTKLYFLPISFLAGFTIMFVSIYEINRRIGRRPASIWSKLLENIRRK